MTTTICPIFLTQTVHLLGRQPPPLSPHLQKITPPYQIQRPSHHLPDPRKGHLRRTLSTLSLYSSIT